MNEKPRIYHARIALGETQEQFARRVGIHPVTLSRLESAAMVPGKRVAERIASITGQSWGEVIDEYLSLRKGSTAEMEARAS